jgi:hypothetical protein
MSSETSSVSAKRAAAADLAAATFLPLQEQHFCLSLTSQEGFSHWSWHLGRGQVVGLAQDQEHEVSSHKGAQLALGATQVVWH